MRKKTPKASSPVIPSAKVVKKTEVQTIPALSIAAANITHPADSQKPAAVLVAPKLVKKS